MKKTLYILLGLAVVFTAVGFIVLSHPKFGKYPRGERLARIEKSPHYKDGEFQNFNSTYQKSSKGRMENLYEIFIKGIEGVRPKGNIPAVKTDLKNLDPNQNIMVWFGHSSYFLQVDGKKYLIDPTLVSAAPFSFMNKAFKGTDIYSPEDIPAVDYLIITHDHWDHLDYRTITAISGRIGKVVTALGTGAHLEHWGIAPEKITELDWYESVKMAENITFTALPTRHYSGRKLARNKALWASYMLQTPSKTIYIGGDSGYDDFFKKTGQDFPNIDLALLENGQYNEDWRYIHFLPEKLLQTMNELKAKRYFTGHNSKYALGKHPWQEPLENIRKFHETDPNLNIITPKIGEIVDLNDENQTFDYWWEGIK